jgi:iron-sulfur cluster repair protein YtfE (RIC family)
MQTDSQLPVRGNDAVEILTNDHEVLRGILNDFTAASGTEQRRAALEQLKAGLTIHNATEENLVYPALAKVAGKKAEAQKLYHETAEADILIFEIDSMLKEGETDGIDAKAEKLQSAILEHMEDEESKAFPHLQDNAEPQQAQMLTQSVREFRSAMQFSGMKERRTEMGEITDRGTRTQRTPSG